MQLPPVSISERQADLSSTDTSTAQTVADMVHHIRQAVNDPEVQRVAYAAAAAEAPGADRAALCRGVWAWLKRNIQFVPDQVLMERLFGPRGADELELLISPSVMVRSNPMQGDCDCFTMTGCAMLACLGVPPVIKTYKCDRQQPTIWSHVCAGGSLEDGSVFPVDASHGDYPGWQVPQSHTFQVQLWDMQGRRVGGKAAMGLGAYKIQPGWTGDPMTASRGVGPYYQMDVMRMWSPAKRMRGLGIIARRGRGLGDTCIDYAEDGVTCINMQPDDTSGGGGLILGRGSDTLSGPTGPGAAPPITYSPTAAAAGGTAAPSFNLNQLLSNLFSAGTKLGSQALLQPGQTMLANGTVVGQPVAPASSSLGALMPIIIIGGIILFAASRK